MIPFFKASALFGTDCANESKGTHKVLVFHMIASVFVSVMTNAKVVTEKNVYAGFVLCSRDVLNISKTNITALSKHYLFEVAT